MGSAVITHTVGEPIVKEHTAVVPPLPTTARGRLRPHLRPRPTPTSCTVDTDTAMDLATDMEAMEATVTTARGRLMLSLRLIPTSCTVATTATVLAMATATLMDPDTPTTDKV